MTLRWGIVSAGKISNDFVCALATRPAADHQVIAIGARSLTSAQNFAKTHNIPKAYEGYVKLAQDDEIDAVYIGNLNPQHFEVSKMMLEHGKHVLCEKPLTLNERQTRDLIEIARTQKRFLMEAMWSRCFPVYDKLRELLSSEAIGNVLHLNVSFGFNLQNIDRVQAKDLGGGTILDLGVYVLQLQQLVFNGEEPKATHVDGGLNKYGTDDWCNFLFSYTQNKTAFMTISALAEYPNEAVIVGTKGIIRIPEFWSPTKITACGQTYEFELPKSTGKFCFRNSVGLAYEADQVRKCIQSGLLESPLMSHDMSIHLAKYMTDARKSIGVVFEEDN